jgi:CubicO group peptidase (beta-lactamase class C family)
MSLGSGRTAQLLTLFAIVSQPAWGQAPATGPRLDPGARGVDTARLEWVENYLRAQATTGAFPGGVLVVGLDGAEVYHASFGHYGDDDLRPVTDSTIYDLASLTKVIGLTTATMLLVTDGRLALDDRVVDHVPSFAGPRKTHVRVRHLLTHTSGLAPWVALHLETTSREQALDRVNASPLRAPPGEQYAYSDLGAIVLTQVVEAASGTSLDDFLARRVFEPLGMDFTRFQPPTAWHARIAPTEHDPWRGRVLRGEVHDENAARLGGVSGHAGLFSSGPDLARFARWILDAYHGRLSEDAPLFVPSDLVREFTRKQPGPRGSTRALGWDTPTPSGGGSGGRLLSPGSFGHTGFTGTSIWIDPVRDLFIILLTNRVHPTRANTTIRRVRAVVADSVVAAIIPR